MNKSARKIDNTKQEDHLILVNNDEPKIIYIYKTPRHEKVGTIITALYILATIAFIVFMEFNY